MVKLKFFFLFLWLISFLCVEGQKALFLNVAAGVSDNRFGFSDNGYVLRNRTIFTPYFGILLDQQIHGNLSIESGLVLKTYSNNVSSGNHRNPFSNPFSILRVPFNIKGNISLFKGFFTGFLIGGPSLSIVVDKFENLYLEEPPNRQSFMLSYDLRATTMPPCVFLLFETAAGFSIRLTPRCQLGAKMSYVFRFQRLYEADVSYENSFSFSGFGKVWTKGNSLMNGIFIGYRL